MAARERVAWKATSLEIKGGKCHPYYYLDYKSSKALLMEAFSDFITMKTRGQNGW